MVHTWAWTEALICVWWTQPPLGQVKGFVVLIARTQGPSSVAVGEEQTASVPVVPANTGQAHLLSARPFLAVSLGTHHLPTSFCSDLLPRRMQRDPSLVLQQDLAIFESAFGERSCFPDFI